MNTCQESNKNQSCGRKSRDSLLSTFMMKRVRLDKALSGGLPTELQFSPEPNSLLAYEYSALALTLLPLKRNYGAHWGTSLLNTS